MTEELVSQSVELPDGALRVLQPREAAELPDAGAVEWAPLAPYWAVLWRSGVPLLSLLPRLAPETWLADPGRPAAGALLEAAARRWRIDARIRGVVRVHRLRLRCRPPHRTTR